MSKSYSKVKRFGICTGSNTEFYRDKRRNIRIKEKQVIRDTLAHNDVSEFDEVYTPLNIRLKDDWKEPTDGTFVMTGRAIVRDMTKKRNGSRCAYVTKGGKVKK